MRDVTKAAAVLCMLHGEAARDSMRKEEVVMNSFRLTEEEVNYLAEKYPTPFMVVSLDKVEKNYHYLRHRLPGVKVFYAIKANPEPAVLPRLASLGSNFDVASEGEIRLLRSLGIDGSRMIYANPVKPPDSIRLAAQAGVDKFTFDDESEIEKMTAGAPGAQVLVRVQVENDSAVVNLNEKFGVVPDKALSLLHKAKEAGLVPAGICFHVGSQSLKSEAYGRALTLCRRLFDEAEQQGMKLTVLDIGGGLPIPEAGQPEPDLDAMTEEIRRHLDRLFPEVEIWSEPGRYMCGTAVNLVTRVIGTKERNGQPWYVLDDGMYGSYNGLVFDHWTYKLEFFQHGVKVPSVFVGPSCDSIDVVARDYPAPVLQVGSLVLSPEMGAYSSSAATGFNGFQPAKTIVYEDNIGVAENISAMAR